MTKAAETARRIAGSLVTYSHLYFGGEYAATPLTKHETSTPRLTLFTMPGHLMESFWLDAAPRMTAGLERGHPAAPTWPGLSDLQLLLEALDPVFSGDLTAHLDLGPMPDRIVAPTRVAAWLNVGDQPLSLRVSMAPNTGEIVDLHPAAGCIWSPSLISVVTSCPGARLVLTVG
jgi:hypothetical protein